MSGSTSDAAVSCINGDTVIEIDSNQPTDQPKDRPTVPFVYYALNSLDDKEARDVHPQEWV